MPLPLLFVVVAMTDFPLPPAPHSFIVKYSPVRLEDFLRVPNAANDASVSAAQRHMELPIVLLSTLIRMDDMNVLLIGGTNSGKTSLLYAMLREYYGLSKSSPFPETNVLFINNLKEQGIQFFRSDMKTFCQTHCTIPRRKKVIVVDDLDTINKQSQQVFRNYLDKYKGHVCMVASCSNSQKVIESLQSRLTIVRVLPPSSEKIARTLQTIVRTEGIPLEADAQTYLLNRSHHSVRNVINNLEKIDIYRSAGEVIDRAVCERLCSTISFRAFELYLDALKAHNLPTSIRIIYGIYDYGYSVIDILEYFFEFVKVTPLLTEAEKYAIAPHICDYITIFHDMHEHSIELALFTRNVYNVCAGDDPHLAFSQGNCVA